MLDGLEVGGCVCSNEYEKSRTEEAAKYLEQTKLQTSNGFTEEFSVMEDLMGLAIEAHGANIQQARKIDGIINVELIEDSCTFKVSLASYINEFKIT